MSDEYHTGSDNAFGRVFEVALGALPNATVASAIAACNARGFSLTGIEFKSEVCELTSLHTEQMMVLTCELAQIRLRKQIDQRRSQSGRSYL